MNWIYRQSRSLIYPGLKIIIILICLLALDSSDKAQAQEPTIFFERLSLEQGLSHGSVYSIVQDQTGFLWFGTQSGLNRYDGYQMTVFKHNPLNPNSLSNDNAGNLYIDKEGIIWIGTWGGGLNRLDPRTEQFTIYRNEPDNPNSLNHDRVQTIFEDSAGILWVGTSGGGLNRFDRKTGTFSHYLHNPNDPNSLSHNRLWRIVEDKEGMLWLATSDGLNRFDPRTETFTRYKHDPDNPNSLSHNLIRTLYVDRAGTLWVGAEDGLNRFNSETDTFIRYKHDPTDPDSLSDNTINAILEDREGTLWIGTSRGGLNKFNRQTESFSHYTNNPKNPKSLSYNDIRWLHEDQSGLLWVATRGGGVNKFNPNLASFKYLANDPDQVNSLNNNDVRAIHVDQAQNLWIGTKGGGLNKFDPVSRTFTSYQHDPNNPNSLSSNDIYAIHQDRAGQLWLGTAGGGLVKFEPQTQTFTRYPADPANPTRLSSPDINFIYEDPSGMLWVGTKGGGLNQFDPETEQFTRYQYNADDSASLGNDDVYAIVAAPADTLWIATYGGGLNRLALPSGQRFDVVNDGHMRHSGQFRRYQHDPTDPNSLSNNDVYALYPDPTGLLWIGTANGGLSRFDPEMETFVHWTQQDGLSSDVVFGVLPDEAGNLWLSTSKGLSKFNPQTGTFTNYDTSDGLERIGYNEGAYYKSQDGRMFFGGINGLISFNPAEIKDNGHVPPVVLTALNLPHKKTIPFSDLVQSPVVELSYEDDVVSFEFAALDYANPSKNRYAYRLEGFDTDWVEAENRRLATYTNLDPGSYTFWVKGANNAGVWNETGTSLKVIIRPPFWETWWFRGIALLLGLGIIFTGYKLRVKNIETQKRTLQALVTEKTRELVTANQHLQALTNQLHTELTLAQDIQRNLLPPPHPPWPDLDVVCHSVSATEVGGDFYAYHAFTSQNSHVALAVGDASGKGMPAALIMAVSMTSFQSIIDHALSPAALLVRLDEAILPYTQPRRQNCALCYIEIKPPVFLPAGQSRKLRMANAGCIAPIIRRMNSLVEWIDIGGLPLGMGIGAQKGYAEAEISLEPGDIIILTSDGVVEATNLANEMFGFERLKEVVAAGPTSSAQAMLDHLKAAISAFIKEAEPHDDMTIVIVQV